MMPDRQKAQVEILDPFINVLFQCKFDPIRTCATCFWVNSYYHKLDLGPQKSKQCMHFLPLSGSSPMLWPSSHLKSFTDANPHRMVESAETNVNTCEGVRGFLPPVPEPSVWPRLPQQRRTASVSCK